MRQLEKERLVWLLSVGRGESRRGRCVEVLSSQLTEQKGCVFLCIPSGGNNPYYLPAPALKSDDLDAIQLEQNTILTRLKVFCGWVSDAREHVEVRGQLAEIGSLPTTWVLGITLKSLELVAGILLSHLTRPLPRVLTHTDLTEVSVSPLCPKRDLGMAV